MLTPARSNVLLHVCLLATAAVSGMHFTSLAQTSEQSRPAEGVQDNSFLMEEAYNQEPGVVQHILNISRSVNRTHGGDEHEWALVFTQEWPFFSQKHQLSYTVPYSFVKAGEQSENGNEDVLLNYRLQALMETDRTPAFAPRLSLVLPAGDADRGLGNDTLGYQLNLPVSKVVSDRWTVHANAGGTLLPEVNGRDLVSYNLGVSAIYAVTPRLNLMLECVANWDEEVDDRGRKDRSFSAIASPGLRYAFNHSNDAQTVVGLAAPIGLTRDAPDYGVILYFSFEHFFLRPSPRPAKKFERRETRAQAQARRFTGSRQNAIARASNLPPGRHTAMPAKAKASSHPL
ncbi:MAG: transporter [Verrucomicrobiota bacterium]|nr:transporter [Verrucomicrobiota bacterium]